MNPFHILKAHAESLYHGSCTITSFQKKDGIINDTVPVVVAENEPCRLTYGNALGGKATDTGTAVTQSIRLFLRPDILIAPGSQITVTQDGRESTFEASGQPMVYTSHQEIELTAKGRWA